MNNAMKNFFCLLLALSCSPLNASNILPGEELFKAPFYSNPQLSPDGRYVIGKLFDGQKRELVITDANTQQRYPVVFFAKGNYLRNFYWIDSDSIYIEYKTPRRERKSIININTDNLSQKSPTQQIEVDGYLLSALPDVEDQILFARQTNKEQIDVFQISTKDLVDNDFTNANSLDPQLDNALVYFYDEKSTGYFGLTVNTEEESAAIWFLASDSKKWRQLYNTTDLSYQFQVIQYLSDNKFLVLTDKNSERIVVAVFDLVSQEVEKVVYEHPQFNVIAAEADEQTGELLSVTYINRGHAETEYLQQEQADFHNFIVESEDDDPIYTVDTSADGSRSIIFAYGAAHPGTYILYDEKRQTSKLIEHAFPDLLEHEFAKTRRIEVPLGSGETLDGFLTIPYLNANGSLLVMLEVGGSSTEKLTEFSRSVQYFANRGYAVLRVNYQSPVTFTKDDDNELKVSIDSSLEANINQLVTNVKQQFGYQKVCPIGYGDGGYSALRLSMLFKENYHCAVSLFGVYDYQLLFSADNAQVLNLNQQAIKDLLQKQSTFVEQSPVYLADGFNKPVLLVGGDKDDAAVPEQFNRMKYVLQKHSDALEYHQFRNTEHGVDTWFEEQQIHAVIDDFLRRHLNLPKIETIAEPSEAAKEYVKISDMFSFDTLTDNDPQKSFEYLVRASELEHPRAMFNHGAHYHRGDLVEKSMEKAVEWYQKSSDAGYASASFRLGEIYETNLDIGVDKQKAYQYFIKADEQGADALAGLKIANYVCKGDVVKRDEALCYELLDLKKIRSQNRQNIRVKVTSESRKVRNKMMPGLMLQPNITASLRASYKTLIKDFHSIDDVAMRFELVDEGIYSNKTDKHIETTYDFPVDKNISFGIQFKLHTPETFTPKEKGGTRYISALVRIRKTVEGKQPEIIVQRFYSKAKKNHQKDWYVTRRLKNTSADPGKYDIEIFNLDGELYYSQSFIVRAKED